MKYKIIFLPQVKSAPVKFCVGKQYKQEVPLLIISHSSSDKCEVLWEREKFAYTTEEDYFQGFYIWKAFPYFLFLLHCTMILELLSLDEGCWVFSHLGFPGKNTHVIVLCFIYLLVILLINAIKIYFYNLKKI